MSDDTPESGAFEGIASLVRLAGFNLPERARFAGGAIITSSMTALTVGFVCGQIGGVFFLNSLGPLVPFLCGSWAGFSFGLMHYWSSAKTLAINCAKRYPAVLAHALQLEWDMVVPQEVVRNSVQLTTKTTNYSYETAEKPATISTLDQWILQGGLSRISLAVLSAQGCQSGAAELMQAERQLLFEQQQERRKQLLEKDNEIDN